MAQYFSLDNCIYHGFLDMKNMHCYALSWPHGLTKSARQKETSTLAKVQPFHSKRSGKVYHNNDKCTEGNNIERANRAPGTGSGRHLCKRCKRLNQKRK